MTGATKFEDFLAGYPGTGNEIQPVLQQELFVGTKRRKLPGMGEFDSGRSDTSEKADEILREAAKRGRWR